MKNPERVREVGNDLTEGAIFPKLIRFVLPLLLANVIQQLYNAVDMVIIGQYVGSVGTVGVSTGGNIASFLTLVAAGFSGAAQIYIAQLSGAKDEKAIQETISTVLSFMLVISFSFTILSIVFCRTFLSWLNCPEEAFEQAVGYMRVVSLGYPFIFGYNAICGIMRGMGDSKKPLLFITIAAVSNVLMDLLFVAVFPLEAVGTAIATAAAQMVSFVSAMIFILLHYEKFHFSLTLSSFRIYGKRLAVVAEMGVPLVAQSAFIQFSQLVCAANINSFGMVASATNSIGDKIQRLVNIFMASITQGAGAMVGQNLGAQKYDRVPKIVKTSLAFAMVCAILSSAFSLFAPRAAYSIFTKDPDVIDFGVVYLRICIIIYFLSSIQGCFQSVTTACGNTRLNFVAGILDGVVLRLGIGFLLAYGLSFGVVGFFYGHALARIAPAVIHFMFYRSGKWAKHGLLKKQNAVTRQKESGREYSR